MMLKIGFYVFFLDKGLLSVMKEVFLYGFSLFMIYMGVLQNMCCKFIEFMYIEEGKFVM